MYRNELIKIRMWLNPINENCKKLSPIHLFYNYINKTINLVINKSLWIKYSNLLAIWWKYLKDIYIHFKIDSKLYKFTLDFSLHCL